MIRTMSIKTLNSFPTVSLNSAYGYMPTSIVWNGKEFIRQVANFVEQGMECLYSLDNLGAAEYCVESSPNTRIISAKNLWSGSQIVLNPGFFQPYLGSTVSADTIIKNYSIDYHNILRVDYNLKLASGAHTRINPIGLSVNLPTEFNQIYYFNNGGITQIPTTSNTVTLSASHPIFYTTLDKQYAIGLYCNNTRGYYLSAPNRMMANWWYKTSPPAGNYIWTVWVTIDTFENAWAKLANHLVAYAPTTQQMTTPGGVALDLLPASEVDIP